MPDYVFSRVDAPKQTISLFYHMNDVPSIGAVITDDEGVKWKRLAVKPQASFDTHCDPFSAKDFVKATNKPDTIGSMWDRSKEMSLRRAEKDGIDAVKQKFYDDHAKKHRGRRHVQEIREAGTRHLKSKGISVDWGDDD